jgi:hypothetical protein
LKNFTAEKKILVLIENCNLFLLKSLVKKVQVTGEAFSSQKRTSSTSKHYISSLSSIFVGHVWLKRMDRIEGT